MQHRHGKINTYLFYLLMIIEMFIVLLLVFKQHNNVSFQNEPLYHINDNWTYQDDNGSVQTINLPAKIKNVQNKVVMISRKLPKHLEHITAFGILSTHQSISAYIDNTLIYAKIIRTEDGLFNVPSGNTWQIIPLPAKSEGKTLTLRISSPYNNYVGNINEVHIGTKSSLLIHLIRTTGYSLVLAFITLMNGFVGVFIYLFLKKLLHTNRSILYLGWFSIIVSILSIMESNLTQIFMDNEYVISALSYLSLMTLPIPILLYISLFENFHYLKTIHNLTYIIIGSDFLFIILQVLNISDFYHTEVFVQAELLLVFVIVIITLYLEICKYKDKELKSFTIAATLLFIFGAVDITAFHIKTEKHTGLIFQVGFILFSVILIIDTLKKLSKTIKLSEAAWHYKSLATKDLLTNCRNRAAYAKDMEAVSLDRNITIFISDMNNMKKINDTYGHHAGDEVIILCSQCLLKVFGRRVYRIGGDEFVSIQYDLEANEINAMLENFQRECSIKSEALPYGFQMSVGYAVYNNTLDETIYDTVKRADMNMYENKRKMKEIK